MSGGIFSVDAPHICGEVIHVEISWSYTRGYRPRNGDPGDPPNYDEDWRHPDNCPKCGVDLGWDTIFQETVTELTKRADVNEYDGGDDIDYDPPEDYEYELRSS